MRAKFRCLEISHQLKQTVVKLKPVIAKNDDWPDGSEENRMFWSASPTGEMSLTYMPDFEVPFAVGSYYYIDMFHGDQAKGTNDRPPRWKLWSLEHSETSLSVNMGMEWEQDAKLRHGSFQISIENQKVWASYEGTIGKRWIIDLSLADGSHDSCPYTG